MDNSSPNVSVIIPTFNRSDLLKRALNSVDKQSHQALEIIVVDDGSSDQTAQMIAQHFASIIYIQDVNKGVSAARNTGIARAKADWIALLDSDDEWLPDKLALQVAALQENPDYKFCHSNEIWVRNGKRVNQQLKHEKKGGWIFQHCLPLCAISPSSVLIHRSIFDHVGKFSEQYPACEDYDLWLRITHQFPVLYVDTPLLMKYGGHADQLSRQHWGMDRFRIAALADLLDTADLQATDRLAAQHILLKKIEIYLLGARKRNKTDDIEHYSQLLERYQDSDASPK